MGLKHKWKIHAEEYKMKFQKPTYDSSQQVYLSDIKEGIRCEAIRNDEKQFEPEVSTFYTAVKESFTDTIIQQTKGWFRKPLTKEWLEGRITFHIPTQDIPEGFEGHCIWVLKSLRISKEKFDFTFGLVEMKEAEKVIISFEEPEPELAKKPSEKEQMTRRFEDKQRVLKMRSKAARSLFVAERATQMYCQLYGEDTDWETTDSETE
jgi:hypothetical protein